MRRLHPTMRAMSTEIELKFQIPAGALAAVEVRLASLGTVTALPLQARYVDTAERHLARAGLALRLRREGGPWVQTLKGRGDDLMTRLEHNAEAGEDTGTADEPVLDLSRHDGTPAGVALQRALASVEGDPGAALNVRFATDILRRWVHIRHGAAQIELALDVGRIEGGGHSLPVCELEFELIGGEGPSAVADLLDAVLPWVTDLGLWLDPRSKAERGDRLATARLGRAAAVPEEGPDSRTVLTALIRNTAEAAEFGAPDEAARARSAEVQGALLAGLRAGLGV